jgi:hypothetical protein
MGLFPILALFAAALPLRAFAGSGSGLARYSPSRGVAFFAAAALAAAFVGYEVCFNRAIVEAHPASMIAGQPILFLVRGVGKLVSASRADELGLLALVEAIALGTFLAHLEALGTRARRATAGLVATALAAAALVMPASDSSDSYLYVGLGTLGVHAYAPDPVPFRGDLHLINAIWGTPLFPSAYGPVWIAVSALLIAPLASLGAKLFAFKVLGLASVLACAYLARLLGAARVVVAGIVCNPGLYVTYVASAHNDLFAIDLVLVAMLAARRSVPLAYAFALAASLVKLTLVPVAVVAVARQPSIWVRASFAVLLALAVGMVYAVHGGLLWHALTPAMQQYQHGWSPLEVALRAALVAVALGAGAWIVVSGRVRAQAAWAPPALGASILASYTIWGLPLALTATPVAVVYLVTLPILLFFQSPTLPGTPALEIASYSFLLLSIFVAIYRLRPAIKATARPPDDRRVSAGH